jgi:calcineurin-like phosphoesterase family protein
MSYCDRPYGSVGEMNDDMVARFLAKTEDADEVFILGDIFGSCQPEFPSATCEGIMEKLGVRKRPFHLVLGNHDTLEPREYLAAGFVTVKAQDFITIGELNVMLTHDPCMVQQSGTLAICGHIHTLFEENWQPARNTFTINVGVEARGYEPVSEAEIIALIQDSPYRRQL